MILQLYFHAYIFTEEEMVWLRSYNKFILGPEIRQPRKINSSSESKSSAKMVICIILKTLKSWGSDELYFIFGINTFVLRVSLECITVHNNGYLHIVDYGWQYRLWSFQAEGTKLERFWPKNQHTQRKLLNFEFWINGELSKSVKASSNVVSIMCPSSWYKTNWYR